MCKHGDTVDHEVTMPRVEVVVLAAGGYTVETFATTMGRLAALDAYNRLTSARALLVAEQTAARAAMDAELGELEAAYALEDA